MTLFVPFWAPSWSSQASLRMSLRQYPVSSETSPNDVASPKPLPEGGRATPACGRLFSLSFVPPRGVVWCGRVPLNLNEHAPVGSPFRRLLTCRDLKILTYCFISCLRCFAHMFMT